MAVPEVKRVKIKSINTVPTPDHVVDIGVGKNHNLFACNKIDQLPVLSHNCIAGEVVLDENLSELKGTGAHVKKPYSLDTIAARYGNLWYQNAKFGKDERATIKDQKLSQDVLDYAGFDVQVLLGIRDCQLQIAKLTPHLDGNYREHFYRFMLVHMSSMVHMVSTMKLRGMPVDLYYLLKLVNKQQSPLLKQLDVIELDMRKFKSVQEANNQLMGDKGAPKKGLFGASKAWIFSLSKPSHKQKLFIDILKLKPLAVGPNGAKIDKAFQKKYKDTPEVAKLSERSKVSKLYDTYAAGFHKLFKYDRDIKTDHRVRPEFDFKKVTGRTSCSGPNLQQIPEHGDLAPIIKRLFVASPGTLQIKFDFSAHEVRFWCIISQDSVLLKAFNNINKLIVAARKKKELSDQDKKQLKTEGDIHRQNYSLFTGVSVEKVSDVQRQDSKAIGFGAIYGKSVKTMAKDLNKTVEEMQKVFNNFFGKFKRAKDWLDEKCRQSLKYGYVHAPTGRRRNMWAGVLGYQRCYGDVTRRAQNSPVQGIASDDAIDAARLIELEVYWFLTNNKLMDKDVSQPPIGTGEMVHDATKVESPYALFFIALWITEYCAIYGARKFFKQAYGMELNVDFAIEISIGATGDKMRKWDWSKKGLRTIIHSALKDQKEVLGHKIDPDETLKLIYSEGKKYAGKLQKQYPLPVPLLKAE